MSKKQTIALFLSLAFIAPVASFAMQGSQNENERMGKMEEKREEKSNKFQASTTIDVACVQKAIGVREDALIQAFDAFAVSSKAALSARKDALVLAWAKTDPQERRLARKAAYDAHKEVMRKAHDAIRSARKAAWATFNTEVKKCPGANGYGEIMSHDYPTSL